MNKQILNSPIFMSSFIFCPDAVILRQEGVYFIEFVTHYDYNSLPFLDVIFESAFHVSDKRILCGCVLQKCIK